VPASVPDGADPGRGAVLLLSADACRLGNGDELSAPESLADALELAAALGIRGPKVARYGWPADGAVYLDAGGCARYGLPLAPPDARSMALPDRHPAAVALREAGWTVRQVMTSFAAYRGSGPDRVSLTVTLLPWAIRPGTPLAKLTDDDPSPASLTGRLESIAATAWPLQWTPAVTSERLMTATRPPSRMALDRETGRRDRVAVAGSLTAAVAPSIHDAHDAHPIARNRPEADACREEALIWTRPLADWTDTERAAPYAVAVDENLQFLAGAKSLPVGLSAPREMFPAEVTEINAAMAGDRPRIGPGVYVAEVSGLDLPPGIPSPLTPTGQAPGGPLPLHAPTLRYVRELAALLALPVSVTVHSGWVSDVTAPYLDPWAIRLRDAYYSALASAGITPDMDPAAFLAARAELAARHPDAAAVVAVVKSMASAGIGRLRQDPDSPRVLERPTWRPDIRAEVISAARTGLHRKIVATWLLNGAAPLAVSHDAITYAAWGPGALDVLPAPVQSRPVPFRAGARPGWVKHGHTHLMARAVAVAEAGGNVARAPDDEES
jgi:hypothetical protein